MVNSKIGYQCKINAPFDEDMLIDMKELTNITDNVMNETDLIKQATIFAAEWPLLRRDEQDRLILHYFQPSQILKPNFIPIRSRHMYCEICMMRDEEKYGFAYEHREHQFEGVTVCYQHGCTLRSKDTARAWHVWSAEHCYAKFAASLCDKIWMDCCAEEVLAACKERIKSNWAGNIPRLFCTMAKLGYEVFIPRSTEIKKLLFDEEIPRIPFRRVCALCSFLFTNAEDLWDAIQKLKTEPSFLLPDGYRIVSEDTPLCRVSHDQCGKEFIATKSLLNRGYLCPHCSSEIPEKDIVERLIDVSGNGNYKMQESYQGFEKKTTILHECGRTLQTTPYEFVWRNRRCECITQSDFDRAAEKVRQKGEFDLVEYHGINEFAQILCRTCGKPISCKFRNFIERDSFCKFCLEEEKDPYHYAERVKRALRTGYKLKDYYTPGDKTVTLSHFCGTTYKVSVDSFLDGEGACPTCFPSDNSKFMQIIKTHPIVHEEEVLLDYLHQRQYALNLFFVEDATIARERPETVERLFEMAKLNGKLKKLCKGVYTYPEERFTDEQIMSEMFLVRNNERIGCLIGDSFLYEIGLSKEKPEFVEVMTNKIPDSNRRTFHVGSVTVKIRKGLCDIDEYTYAAHQIFFILEHFNKYKKEYGEAELLHALVEYAKENPRAVKGLRELAVQYAKTGKYLKSFWREFYGKTV